MSGNKIRVALVGGGMIAPVHAKYLQSSPTSTLVAIIDPFPPGRDLAAKLSVPHFESLKALLSSSTPPPDSYIICVPSHLHVQIAREVIESASPRAILVEKPLSTDSESALQLLRFAEQKGCTILVGHHRRHHSAIDVARQAVQSGKLGTLTAVSGVWTIKKPDSYYQSAPWRARRSGGGGPIWTNFVHDIDTIHYLTGSHARKVWVVRTPSRRQHPDVSEAELVEEGAAIIIEFHSGLVGTFLVSDNVTSPYSWELATGENPAAFPKASIPVGSYRLFGTDGTLSVPEGYVWTYRKDQVPAQDVGWNLPIQRTVLPVPEGAPYYNQTEHLARVVKGEEAPRCSAEDGWAAVNVCEAIVSALQKNDGQPVLVPNRSEKNRRL